MWNKAAFVPHLRPSCSERAGGSDRSGWKFKREATNGVGSTMAKTETFTEWMPHVFGRERLDRQRWAYLIASPFEMPAHTPDLLGVRVHLDGQAFEIRGTLPRVPPSPIKKDELLGLLVRIQARPEPL
jgi:hypothetical protein